jgi:coenzyme Q-binding protein COQ10
MFAELAVGFGALRESYLSEVSCWKDRKVVATAADTSLFKTMKTTWTFGPASNSADVNSGPAKVDFDITFAFNNPVHAAAAQAFFERVSGDVMDAFEKRCREVYGNGGARL